MEAILMKNSQLLQAWSMRSVTRGDGRRLITVWRGEEPSWLRGATVASRARKGQPIAVKFGEEAASAFSPAIRRGPAAPALVPPPVPTAQLPETL